MNTLDTAPWTGWHRPHSQAPWRKVTEAESERGCWDLLLAHAEGGDKTVLPSHRHPDDKPQRMATVAGEGRRE